MYGKGVVSLALLVLFLASHGHVANAQCSDFYSFCGSLYSNCYGYLNGMMIRMVCPLTCGVCQATVTVCVDSSPACRLMTRYCSFTNVTVLGKTIKEYCKLSCANCPSTTTTTTTTPFTTTTTTRTTTTTAFTTTTTYNGCLPNPCKNGATCSIYNNMIICLCPSGQTGADCATRSSR